MQNTDERTTQTQIQTDKVEVISHDSLGWLKSGNLQIFITLAGVAVTLFNLWIASKLTPVANDINTITQKVSAQDVRLNDLENVSSLYLPRYIATEQQTISLKETVNRIESGMIRMEAKLDRVIENK